MKLSLIALLVLSVSGCAQGSFCDLYTPVEFEAEATSRFVVKNDRTAAKNIAVNNAIHDTCKG